MSENAMSERSTAAPSSEQSRRSRSPRPRSVPVLANIPNLLNGLYRDSFQEEEWVLLVMLEKDIFAAVHSNRYKDRYGRGQILIGELICGRTMDDEEIRKYFLRGFDGYNAEVSMISEDFGSSGSDVMQEFCGWQLEWSNGAVWRTTPCSNMDQIRRQDLPPYTELNGLIRAYFAAPPPQVDMKASARTTVTNLPYAPDWHYQTGLAGLYDVLGKEGQTVKIEERSHHIFVVRCTCRFDDLSLHNNRFNHLGSYQIVFSEIRANEFSLLGFGGVGKIKLASWSSQVLSTIEKVTWAFPDERTEWVWVRSKTEDPHRLLANLYPEVNESPFEESNL